MMFMVLLMILMMMSWLEWWWKWNHDFHDVKNDGINGLEHKEMVYISSIHTFIYMNRMFNYNYMLLCNLLMKLAKFQNK